MQTLLTFEKKATLSFNFKKSSYKLHTVKYFKFNEIKNKIIQSLTSSVYKLHTVIPTMNFLSAKLLIGDFEVVLSVCCSHYLIQICLFFALNVMFDVLVLQTTKVKIRV